MKTFSKLREEISEACWKGYKQVGGKMKNGRMVPNCVPVKESTKAKHIYEADLKSKPVMHNGKEIGETGIDSEASPGNGKWYAKHYESGRNTVGFDSREEAKAEVHAAHVRAAHGIDEEVEQLDERGANKYKRPTEKGAGLTRAGVMKYRRENPGSKLSTAVTTEPSKLKHGSKAWNRRKSFCARMSGVKGPMKDSKGRPTRKAMSLRRWHC
jgi:Domain of unknown function (DUF6321)